MSTFSQFSTGRDMKNNSQMNLNEDSFLNFSNVLKNINTTNFNFRYDSPLDFKHSANEQGTLNNFLKGSNMPDINSSQIGDFEHNQSPSVKSPNESRAEDADPSDLFWLEACPIETVMEALELFRMEEKKTALQWMEKISEANHTLVKTSSQDHFSNDEADDRYYLEADEVDAGS